jgi:hypothetical protein
MAQSWIKDPDADLDYQIDWSDWLDDDETIVSSAWILPEGITSDQDDDTDTTATIWLQGGEAGADHRVTNRIATSAGRIEDRTIVIRVRER